jgi:predicted DNA binding protein
MEGGFIRGAPETPTMKQLRVTVHVDTDEAPAFFTLLAVSPAIDETRLLDWNMRPEGQSTILYAIDGDADAFRDDATETDGVESVALSPGDDSPTYALVVVRPTELPLFDAIHRASTRAGLVVRTPIVYRDGDMRARVVGDPDALQRALDDAPAGVTVRVDEIGRPGVGLDDPTRVLSDRQRVAVAVARDLGYYDRPRAATQADVAAELGCTAQTAGEHLRKAEAKLVEAAFDSL